MFHDLWGRIEDHLELSLTSEEALKLFLNLVVYDMPDGTRSTLTVSPEIDVGADAGLYCVALIHTLRGLGARTCIIMTHTSYNRMRGREGMERILRIISKGARPLQGYVRRNALNVRWIGMRPGYELERQLTDSFPLRKDPSFEAFFLIDYAEEVFEEPTLREDLGRLPEVDVCIRHTKLNMSGGWIPGKLLRSTFVYCQNGTLFSNWKFDELVALSTVALLAKLFHTGEGLAKMYGDIDEVKRRYQLRELRLFNKQVKLRPQPRKLFIVGSPLGLYQFYY
jgi:hypothetical protein